MEIEVWGLRYGVWGLGSGVQVPNVGATGLGLRPTQPRRAGARQRSRETPRDSAAGAAAAHFLQKLTIWRQRRWLLAVRG